MATDNETETDIVREIEKRDDPFSRKCETKRMLPRKKRETKTTHHDSWWKGC